MSRNQDSQFARCIQNAFCRDMERCHALEAQLHAELEKAEPDFDRVDALAREIALLRGQMQDSKIMKQQRKKLLAVLFRKKSFHHIEWGGMIAAAIFLGIGLSIFPTIQDGKSALKIVEPTQFTEMSETTVSESTTSETKSLETTAAEVLDTQCPTEIQTTAAIGETNVVSSDSISTSMKEEISKKTSKEVHGMSEMQAVTSVQQSMLGYTTNIAARPLSTTQTTVDTLEPTAEVSTKVPEKETICTTTTKHFETKLTTTRITLLTTTKTTPQATTETAVLTTTVIQDTSGVTMLTTTRTEPPPSIFPQNAYLYLHSYPDKIEFQLGEKVDFTGATISAGYWEVDSEEISQYHPAVFCQDLTSDAVNELIQTGALYVDTSQLDMNTPGIYHVVLWYTYGDTTARASFPICVIDPFESTDVFETSLTTVTESSTETETVAVTTCETGRQG